MDNIKSCDNCKYKTAHTNIKISYYCRNKESKNKGRIIKFLPNKECSCWELKEGNSD